MAGFASKLLGYVFEGEFKTASAMKDGTFCYINSGKLTKTNADKDTKLLVKGKTTWCGLPALRCIVNSVGGDVVYFTENGHVVDSNLPYATTNYEVKEGAYVRAHRLIQGDEIIFTVDAATIAAINEGDIIQPVADGKIGVRNYNNLTIKVNLGSATGDTDADVVVPYTVECEAEPRITADDVEVATTHRTINEDTAGTYATTVVAGDCSLSTAAQAIYKGTITYTITQGSAVIA